MQNKGQISFAFRLDETCNLEGLEEDVQASMHNMENGWTSEVPHRAFRGLARVWKAGRLENYGLPRLIKKAIVKVWSQIVEDHEAWNDCMKSIILRSTDFLRHVVGEVEERGTITFSYVCERCKNVCAGISVVGDSQPLVATA